MQSSDILVTHPVGLRARPAAEFVKTAGKFACNITACNLTTDGKTVNAKSILSILALGCSRGIPFGSRPTAKKRSKPWLP